MCVSECSDVEKHTQDGETTELRVVKCVNVNDIPDSHCSILS